MYLICDTVADVGRVNFWDKIFPIVNPFLGEDLLLHTKRH